MADQKPKREGPRSHTLAGRTLIVLIPVAIVLTLFLLLLGLGRFRLTGDKASVVIGLVIGLLLTSISIIRALSKRLRAEGARKRLDSDRRSPVLYLRSFLDDKTAITATDTHEEHLSVVLREIGPMIAIGRPGDRLAPAGAERRYITDEDWQKEVADLMSAARVVVIQAGASAGLLWEISTLSET
jgi:hypothetical protein